MTDQEVLDKGKRVAGELGLRTYKYLADDREYWAFGYHPSHIHRLLGESKRFYEGNNNDWCEHAHHRRRNGDTGILIAVGPTQEKVESREEKLERVLRGIVEGYDEKLSDWPDGPITKEAKAILSKEQK